MDAPEDRSKALNEHMSSGFAPRADIVAACRHVRFVPILLQKSPRKEAGCALAPNTSLDLEGDYAAACGTAPLGSIARSTGSYGSRACWPYKEVSRRR